MHQGLFRSRVNTKSTQAVNKMSSQSATTVKYIHRVKDLGLQNGLRRASNLHKPMRMDVTAQPGIPLSASYHSTEFLLS